MQIAFVVEGRAGHLHRAGPDPISHVGRRPGAQQPGEIWCCWGRCGVSAATTGAWSPRPGSSSTRPRPMCQAAVETIGLRASPGQALFTGASVVAAINSILGGAGLALLAGRLGHLGDGAALTVGAPPPCWCLDCISGTSSSGSRTSDAGPRRARRRAQGSPIVSRTGPAPSRRPGGVGPLLAQAAAGRTGRTPHSPTRPDIRSGASDLDETHGSLRRPRRARATSPSNGGGLTSRDRQHRAVQVGQHRRAPWSPPQIPA